MTKYKFKRFLSFFLSLIILAAIPSNLPKASALPLKPVPISNNTYGYDYIDFVVQSLVTRNGKADILAIIHVAKQCHLRVTVILEKRSLLFFWKEVKSGAVPGFYQTPNSIMHISETINNLSSGDYRMTICVKVLHMPTMSEEIERFVITDTMP